MESEMESWWYRVLGYSEPKNIPLTWQSGAEQELRLLACAICLTEPGMFDVEGPITAVYRATREGKRGGFLYVERGDRYDGDHYTSRRLMSLGDLAFRLNPFIGMEWIERPGRPNNIQKAAIRVRIVVDPPSAHEKAEAFLTLMDWLDDKFHDPEKRALFGLPPRTATEEGSSEAESADRDGDVV